MDMESIAVTVASFQKATTSSATKKHAGKDDLRNVIFTMMVVLVQQSKRTSTSNGYNSF